MLLIQNVAMGQACVVNVTQPDSFTQSYMGMTLPVAWTKANLYQAPVYTGNVVYFFDCGWIISDTGQYFSCPDQGLDDISVAYTAWSNAANTNGSTTPFQQAPGQPDNPEVAVQRHASSGNQEQHL